MLLVLAVASLGVVMNGLSSSLPERRLIWTPYALASAVLGT
jgi:hypothetical protein